ncbi:YitT family protein [Macrococcoides goetzii]|uniref:YitT family protein n=1 Tax=Macrococcoides goetzii TaxID=1891097 RepID=A0A395G8Z6_9STAP|nr:YitT family protein [Macrococcus goetzii]RAI80462.1 YitT family protein [Macrococcus goetzii]TDM41741.1 YitT family protein [Macrococcus goetzii]TDM48336.1 YitT family protein [Macrococcus goetzii]TDM50644.1 YitT family protein [Macrococcus goetzii]
MNKTMLIDILYTVIGSIIVGISYNLFLLPGQIAAGGISGLSTILNKMMGTDPAMIQFLFNIPIFIIGWFTLGKSFSLKTVIATFVVPFTIFLTSSLVEKGTTDALLASLYGGIVLGIGLGLVYRGNGSTGGTATLAQIVKKYTGLSSGFCQLIVDAFVVILSAFVFNFELALYALISIYVTSKVIDIVQLHAGDNKLVFIITTKEQEIIKLIHEHVERGVTSVNAFGGYNREGKSLLFSVMEQKEAIYFKQIITREEPDSFVIFINTSEIIGRGFSKAKIYRSK